MSKDEAITVEHLQALVEACNRGYKHGHYFVFLNKTEYYQLQLDAAGARCTNGVLWIDWLPLSPLYLGGYVIFVYGEPVAVEGIPIMVIDGLTRR